VQVKIRDLEALVSSLGEFVRSCDTSCPGGAGRDCTILADLAASGAPRA